VVLLGRRSLATGPRRRPGGGSVRKTPRTCPAQPTSSRTLHALRDVGLGYLSLGQTLTTLSGGERQRLELALAIRAGSGTLLLDEPIAGLHLSDVDTLTLLFRRLVDDGRTVIAADHHLRLIAAADHLIDLGPGAGHDGGTITATGTPHDLARHPRSPTGRHLTRALTAHAA